MDNIFLYSKLAAQILYVSADQSCFHIRNVISNGIITKVEVMVSEGIVIKAHFIKALSHRVKVIFILVLKVI